jgi:hypothetical protein
MKFPMTEDRVSNFLHAVVAAPFMLATFAAVIHMVHGLV